MYGFKNIYYDKYTNRMHVWSLDEDGNTIKDKICPEITYYVRDESGNSEIKDIYGNCVKEQKARSINAMRQFIKTANIQTCEANIDPEIKYLQENFNDDKIKIDMSLFQICTIDIEIELGDIPKPFNQMVDDCDNVINLVTVHYSKQKKTYTWGNKPYTGNYLDTDPNWTYFYISDETKMLTHFIKHFRKRNVDIITGWNSLCFDLRYLIDRTVKLGIDLSFSPIGIYEEAYDTIKFGDQEIKNKYYKIAGISQLDGIKIYKNFTFQKEVSYKLGYIGTKVVGEGKIALDDAINKAYETNWNQFVDYNIQDVILVTKIEAKKRFIELTILLCSQACIPFEGVCSSIKVITGYILKYLHRYNMVVPDTERPKKESFPGAYVKAIRGVYKYLVSYDFASLYPTLIRMFNISPETLVMFPEENEIPNLIKTPTSKMYSCDTPQGHFDIEGIYYKQEEGVIPKIVTEIYYDRVKFKNMMKVAQGIEKKYSVEEIAKNNHWDYKKTKSIYDDVIDSGVDSIYFKSQQEIRKILINSFYGILSNPYFCMCNVKNATAITLAGRDVIQYVSDKINDYFINHWHLKFDIYFPEYKGIKIKPITLDNVPVIDTDSNFINLSGVINSLGIMFETDEEYRLWVDKFDTVFLTPFFDKILDKYAKKFNTKNLHVFKREKIITRKLVLKKKKYADIVIENEGDVYAEPKLSVTGIDMVKTTMPSFFKTASKAVLTSMLVEDNKDKTIDMLRDYKTKFLQSSINDIAAPRSVNNYDKWADPLDDYIAKKGVWFKSKTPQHVKASILYNYFIKKQNLVLPFISNGSSIKVVYVNPNNILNTEILAYVGDFPEEFHKYFKIDHETQFYKNFIKLISDFYDAFGWGDVVLEKTNINKFIKF